MQVTEPLRQFLQAARGAGIRAAAAEGIDAARALELVGYGDRAVLKDTLGLVLAKTPDEKALFGECFDLYFDRSGFGGKEAPGRDVESLSPGDGEAALGQMLLNDDRAGLAAAMEQAGRETGLENIRFFTQRNLYARRMLDRMGLRAVEREIEALRRAD